MLCQLAIRNIAVIERAEITFGEGLNILTGETGAGKSIIIDSVNLVLGGRADRTLIRSGADSAYVEALFDVAGCPSARKLIYDMFGDDDEELVISRELSSKGRNLCRINGHMATITQLSKITKDLLDIHGQHEHQSLLNASNHIKVLDSFCGEQLLNISKHYKQKLKEYNNVCEKINSLKIDEMEKQRKLEMLTFQYKEINSIELQLGEEEELRSQRDAITHSSKIQNAIKNAENSLSGNDNLSGGILERLHTAGQEFTRIASIGDQYKAIAERIEQAYIDCEDILMEIQSIDMEASFSDSDIDKIEGRISDINRLKRKYGNTIEEILEYCSSIKQEIDELDENELVMESLEKKKKLTYDELLSLGKKITNIRELASKKLSKSIVEQLVHLGMEKSKFDVKITQKFSDVGELVFYNNGIDIVEFNIATNPGEPLKPLNKIASGGEISRIMLALKTISSDVDEISTLIFDEIDTGISGNMSSVVAQKLATISKNHQVICVTHTAQIAAMADNHNYIEKNVESVKAKTDIRLLNENERYIEISRLVGGNNISQYSDKHAKEIISWSKTFKNSLNS
jgi:DNA repair protein RecN (Recombination protein N)